MGQIGDIKQPIAIGIGDGGELRRGHQLGDPSVDAGEEPVEAVQEIGVHAGREGGGT